MGMRNTYMFEYGDETRTLEYGHLDTGEASVKETGRGDITQFCYEAPACEMTTTFRETEDYSLEDVADTLRRDADDPFIGDIAEILGFWNVPYVKDEKRHFPPHHPARQVVTSSGRRSRVRYGRSAGARVPRASARQRVARGSRGLLRGHGFACGMVGWKTDSESPDLGAALPTPASPSLRRDSSGLASQTDL